MGVPIRNDFAQRADLIRDVNTTRQSDMTDSLNPSDMTKVRKGSYLPSLQVFRGVAAILVAFVHATSQYELNMPVGFLANWFTFGHTGVDFFFVLSGFIIWFIHSGDIGKPSTFQNFAWKRLVRIYPAYWVVLAIRVALFFTAYSAADNINTWEVAKALLLWPARDPIVAVSWTLSHEMLFYSIFGIAILLPKRVSVVLAAAWTVGCVVQTIFPSEHFSLFFLFNHHNLEFAMGALVGYLVSRRTATHGLAWMLAGAGLFISSGALWNLGVHDISTTVLFGVILPTNNGHIAKRLVVPQTLRG